MQKAGLLGIVIAAVAVFAGPAHSETLDLQIDGFQNGGTAAFQAGFVVGEMGAVALSVSGSAQLTEVSFLFGGSTSTQTVTLNIYNDTGADAPGALLYTGDYSVTGSNTAISAIDLSGDSVNVNGRFRVAIEYQHSGTPAIASDTDNTITAGDNFIFASGLGWVRSNLLGVSGDWIIRAKVETQGGVVDAGVGFEDASVGLVDASVGVDAGVSTDAGTEETCQLNSDCLNGSYCGDDNTCATDCRANVDCDDGQSCDSIGRCVTAESSDDGGCNQSGQSRTGLMMLSGLVALFLFRRRRRDDSL